MKSQNDSFPIPALLHVVNSQSLWLPLAHDFSQSSFAISATISVLSGGREHSSRLCTLPVFSKHLEDGRCLLHVVMRMDL
jgi:hypothetical protein